MKIVFQDRISALFSLLSLLLLSTKSSSSWQCCENRIISVADAFSIPSTRMTNTKAPFLKTKNTDTKQSGLILLHAHQDDDDDYNDNNDYNNHYDKDDYNDNDNDSNNNGIKNGDDDNDDDDDDDEPPSVDIKDFTPPKTITSFGLSRGRSSPSQRKAMGTSHLSTTQVHVCSNCGAECVQWMGRCPTCREWNTLQPMSVTRDNSRSSSSNPFALAKGGSFAAAAAAAASSSSWLHGVDSATLSSSNGPIAWNQVQNENDENNNNNSTTTTHYKKKRIFVPNDEEFNSVMGGGIMKGSLTLIGGDPGVGKSTLLLQIAGAVAPPGIGMGSTETGSSNNGPVWYVSGEETVEQIASRAERLNISPTCNLQLWSETLLDIIAVRIFESSPKTTEQLPSLLILDSIQTMTCLAGGNSAAGGITQVRESVALMLRLAKSTGIPIIVVGHVTKNGSVAGPKTVEHMVDCVLYLEWCDTLRMLRCAKNRFGPSTQVGMYEMMGHALLPVSDPSSLLLANTASTQDMEGSAILLALEGTRPLTVEVQALVTFAGGSNSAPRRTVTGIAQSRLLLILGILQKHCPGVASIGRNDIYVNVVGQVRLDPKHASSSDLAVAMVLVSSLLSIPVRADTAFCGEVGLLGELRPSLPAIEQRIEEAKRMGFSRVVVPKQRQQRQRRRNNYYNYNKDDKKSSSINVSGIQIISCSTLWEALQAGLVRPLPRKKPIPATTTKRSVKDSTRKSPGSLNELNLDEPPPILDDEDDEDDYTSFG